MHIVEVKRNTNKHIAFAKIEPKHKWAWLVLMTWSDRLDDGTVFIPEGINLPKIAYENGLEQSDFDYVLDWSIKNGVIVAKEGKPFRELIIEDTIVPVRHYVKEDV